MNRPVAIIAMIASATLLASPVFAATIGDAGAMIVPESGDTGWLLGALCIGLLGSVGGIVRMAVGQHGKDSVPRILTAVTAAMALASLLYFLIGYSLMFDIGGNRWIGGADNAMLNAMGTVRETTTLPETGFALFHLGFVLIAVAQLNALLAPRARPGWLLAFSGLWSLLVLVPIVRAMWGGGWLAEMGAIDSAGGLVIFYATAVSAFVAMVLIGRKKEAEAPAPDHGLHLSGALLLLVGMAAMAGGATLGAGDNSAVAMLTVVTAAMTGALTMAALKRRLDADALASGLMVGVVASAAAGDTISIGSAWLIGVVAAIAVHVTPYLMPKRFAWQDTAGGAMSIAAAAKTGGFLFAIFLAFEPFGGSGYGEGMTMSGQVIAQFVAILAIALWAVFGTLVAALMVGLVLPMRAED
ncbi:MAG: hypothetical protein ABL882_01285 [Sphingopyxis sp.]